jgi:hypothetical protein
MPRYHFDFVYHKPLMTTAAKSRRRRHRFGLCRYSGPQGSSAAPRAEREGLSNPRDRCAEGVEVYRAPIDEWPVLSLLH